MKDDTRFRHTQQAAEADNSYTRAMTAELEANPPVIEWVRRGLVLVAVSVVDPHTVKPNRPKPRRPKAPRHRNHPDCQCLDYIGDPQ